MIHPIRSITRSFPRNGIRNPFNAYRFYSKYHLNDQIYIHDNEKGLFSFNLTPEPTTLAVGWCDSKRNVTPGNFHVNDEFVSLLHKFIGDSIQNDFAFIVEAGANANSFMPIYDFREIPRYGRIPEVDNIYGYVMVNESGKIVPGSYESNNLYRICNGAGLVKLSDYLYEELQKKVKK